MGRILCLAVALLICAISFGDEPKASKTRYYRHEVNISKCRIGVRSGWSNDYEKSVMDKFGLIVSGSGMLYKGPDTPNLRGNNGLKAVSYYYHFNHHTTTHFSIGGFFGFCDVQEKLLQEEESFFATESRIISN